MRAPKTVAALLAATLALSVSGCLAPAGTDGPDGTGAAVAGTTVFEETVSPNEDYVDAEADVVYYTVKVTLDAAGTATVSAESNSAFFEPVSYEVACADDLTADDVSVRWTTLMGSDKASKDDQIAVAVVSVRTADGDVDERKISFVGGAVEMAFEAVPAV